MMVGIPRKPLSGSRWPRGADPDPYDGAVLAPVALLDVVSGAPIRQHSSIISCVAARSSSCVISTGPSECKLLGGIAEHPLESFVYGDETLVLIGQGNADGGGFEHAAPALLAGTQRLFGSSPLRDLRLELGSACSNAVLQFGVCVAQRRLGVLSFADLMLEADRSPELRSRRDRNAVGIARHIATAVTIETRAVKNLMKPSSQ